VLALIIVLLGKAESSIFDSVRAKLSDWTAPVLEGVREPLSGFQKWVENIGGIFTVYDENIRLKQEIAELRKWQEVAGSLQRRLERYEILLKAVPDQGMPTVQARVIGQSSRPFIKTMILNAGMRQGVKAGQAVVDDRGLIGRVYVTGRRTAWVILLTDLDSRIPVTIEPSNRRAIMAGDNSSAPVLELDSPVAARPKAGSRVYSSGDGGQMPAGLPVGVVVGADDDLRVALFADADATDFVHVIDYQVPDHPAPNAAAREMPITPITPRPVFTPSAPPQTTTQTAPAAPAPTTAVAPRPSRTAQTRPRPRVVRAPRRAASSVETAAVPHAVEPAPVPTTPAPESSSGEPPEE
jgi:rod shape-determining protein MreC